MATLTIQRARDSAAIFRRMSVQVDGEVVARLRRGEKQVHKLDAGEHVVQAKMDWTASEPLRVDFVPDDDVSVEVAIPLNALARPVCRSGYGTTMTLPCG